MEGVELAVPAQNQAPPAQAQVPPGAEPGPFAENAAALSPSLPVLRAPRGVGSGGQGRAAGRLIWVGVCWHAWQAAKLYFY